MIYIDRSKGTEPESLSVADKVGRRETVRAKADLKAWRSRGGADTNWKFEFKAYRSRDVVGSLHSLFSGKCAYCESRYAATQPMDVEHWRPKSQIVTASGETVRPGYYWLAAAWGNLLPSCIDCNRSRWQIDALTKQVTTLGKQDQFPLVPGSHRANIPGDEAKEDYLLLNPCIDDPEQYLEFDCNGIVFPRIGISREDRLRAKTSIRVYALNRTGLVLSRRETILLVNLSVQIVRALSGVLIKRPEIPEDLRIILDDLMMAELMSLARRCRPDQPYSAMARQIAERDLSAFSKSLVRTRQKMNHSKIGKLIHPQHDDPPVALG